MDTFEKRRLQDLLFGVAEDLADLAVDPDVTAPTRSAMKSITSGCSKKPATALSAAEDPGLGSGLETPPTRARLSFLSSSAIRSGSARISSAAS
jgi:hypothetical protein